MFKTTAGYSTLTMYTHYVVSSLDSYVNYKAGVIESIGLGRNDH